MGPFFDIWVWRDQMRQDDDALDVEAKVRRLEHRAYTQAQMLDSLVEQLESQLGVKLDIQPPPPGF